MKNVNRLTALLIALLMIGLAITAALAAGEATGTDIPATGTDVTEAPTNPAPVETSNPEPTVPHANPYVTKAPTTEAETMMDPEDFVRRVTALLAGLAEDAVTRTENAILIALDEADDATGYAGSVLAYYFGDIDAITLTSGYSAEVLAGFKAWLAALNAQATETDLADNETFAGFVSGAKVLVGVILPELTDEDVDALLMAILTNGAEGVTLTDEELAARFGEGVTGEVLSVYEQDGYSFCLIQTEDSIVLSVIEAQ